METLFKERGSEAAANILTDMWKAQASQNEKISHRRWLKNEKWLKDYEENFKQSDISSSPFFKVEIREQATFAEVTKRPKKKAPIFGTDCATKEEITDQPTRHNRPRTTTKATAKFRSYTNTSPTSTDPAEQPRCSTTASEAQKDNQADHKTKDILI